jgi:aryl-alcohol dehydrogenase-like predicted oxidoreductase
MVIGTAQLATSYGIANKIGQPKIQDSIALIKKSVKSGITFIDTARGYELSENTIGRAVNLKSLPEVSIVTKLSTLQELGQSTSKLNSLVLDSIALSKENLRVEVLDTVLLHRAEHLQVKNGMIWKLLQKIKLNGEIKKLGVSVQTPEELFYCLEIDDVEHIQMPVNILDWRWEICVDEIKKTKKKRNLTIHARSALLQGLLTSSDLKLWNMARIKNTSDILEWLENKAHICHRSSIVDLCLAYVRSLNWIDGVVVGMETSKQLNQNLKFFNGSELNVQEIEDIKLTLPYLSKVSLNPALWRV